MINPLYTACFRAELKIMRSIRHECLLAPVAREDDLLVLEQVKGLDLDQWINSRKDTSSTPRPLPEQLCNLVATLHAGGVVHHDLRPGTFLVTNEGRLKLIDMGHASWREIPDVILSSGLGPQGDFRYMAPELIQGRRGDPRSDIYTIGVLLHLIYTGGLPFKKQNSSIKTWLRIKKDVQSPRTCKSSLSHKIENVIVKAMAWNVEDRYQWIEDLWEDLPKAEL